MDWRSRSRAIFCLVLVLLSVVLTSCEQKDKLRLLDAARLRELGELPALKSTRNTSLRDEYNRIVQAKGTPVRLTVEEVSDAANAASAISKLYDESLLTALDEKSSALYPVDRFRRRYEHLLEGFRLAMRRPRCDFYIDYRLGFFADMSFIDKAQVCFRLEAFSIAELLDQGDLHQAIGDLGRLFRLVSHLDHEKQLECRLIAAKLRAQALLIVEAIAHHPAAGKAELGALLEIVRQQLAAWPSDADAWIGERAQVMHSYELIRAGYLLDVLTAEELKTYTKDGTLERMAEVAENHLDEDELFYLESIREVIASCEMPFHDRWPTFREIRQRMHEQRNEESFPVFVALLFLSDVEDANRLLAEDRARTEAWAIALSLATDAPRPEYESSPIHGHEYDVTIEAGRVEVWSGNPADRAAVVPRVKTETLKDEG